MKTVEMELKELILEKYGSLAEFCKKPSQRSKFHSKTNTHRHNKSPAERLNKRPTGYHICRQRGSNPHAVGLFPC